uniref:THAP-type domain-containing protein n=1 Tax=Anopheles epiroticus TaxID=199890 RepID=A0A182PHA9_9DIPT
MSSVRICALCQNRSNITDQQTDDALDRITYHKFPTNPERLDQWIEFCNLSKESFPKSAYKFLCSNHFAPECFERDMRGELLYGTKRMTLAKDAIPTIRTSTQQLKRNPNPPLSDEENRKKRKEEVEKLLSGELPAAEPIVNPFRKHTCEAPNTVHILPRMNETEMVQKIVQLEQQTRSLRNEIVRLQGTIESKTEKINFAKAELVNVAILLQELKSHENRHLEQHVTEILTGRFDEGQLAVIMAGPPEQMDEQMTDQVSWTEDELAKALKLRCISKEAFDYVRQQLHYPLPGALQLERWIHTIYLKPGVCKTAFRLLEQHASTLKNIELVCTLSLICTNTPVRYHYDCKRDQLIGPNAQLHCLTVQGIFCSWQQIVHINFDLNLSKQLLETTINELHKIGYHVVAITTDCDRDVARLWASWNVSIDQHYLQHPITGGAIYLYACPARTLATIHRVLIEDGFVMQENNLVITKATLLPILTEQIAIYQRYLSDEIIQDLELNPNLAREFISPATTTALRQLAHLDDDEGELLSTLTTLFDVFVDWYELCMTTSGQREQDCTITQYLITELPYGVCEDEQNIVLDGMFDVMEGIQCVNSDYAFLPQAAQMSINSMRKLLVDLRAYYPEQVKGLPMLQLSTLPMLGTISKLKESLKDAFRPHSVGDVLFHLCKTIVSQVDAVHTTNVFLQKGNLLGNVHLENLRLPEDPPDPELENVNEQNACDYLTRLIVIQLRKKYDYLGEAPMVIEENCGQYCVKPPERGALDFVKPSALWSEQAKKLESYVCPMLNEKKVPLLEGIVDTILARHPRMGRDLLQLYVGTRIAIRVRTLNFTLKLPIS